MYLSASVYACGEIYSLLNAVQTDETGRCAIYERHCPFSLVVPSPQIFLTVPCLFHVQEGWIYRIYGWSLADMSSFLDPETKWESTIPTIACKSPSTSGLFLDNCKLYRSLIQRSFAETSAKRPEFVGAIAVEIAKLIWHIQPSQWTPLGSRRTPILSPSVSQRQRQAARPWKRLRRIRARRFPQ